MSIKRKLALVGLLIFAVIILSSAYVLKQDEQGIIVRFGKVEKVVSEPGFYVKVPVLDSLVTYTKKIIEYDASPVPIVTADKKNLIFDSVAIFSINDPELFFRRMRTISGVQQRLDDSVYSAVRVIAGRMTFDELLYDKRDETLSAALEMSRETAKEYGVDIRNIFFKRISLPSQNENAVYLAMRAERDRIAGQLRAEGQAEAVSIRSEAEKERTQIISEAKRDADIMRGEGDRESQRILASAIDQNTELYSFMKTLEFYRGSLQGTKVILRPDGVLSLLKGPVE